MFELQSVLHAVDVAQSGPGRAMVTLKNQADIPNRDFILRYRTATDAIGDAFLTHTDARGTFFTLVLQPPRIVRPEHAVPKELIFVIDRSGSMSGFPIEKAKETMRLAIERMNPQDTFNLLSFSGGTGHCFTRPVPNTPANRAIALKYLADLHGSGGTEMMPAIMEALGGRPDPRRVRVVAFMTDGYVGNDVEIIDAVRKHAGTARVFAFGIGNAVNRFLLDGMVHAGRGAVDYVTLQSQADEAVGRFQERIHAPLLTDISIDWGKLSVAEVYPKHLPDLFSHQPIMLHGRLQGPVDGGIVLRGHTAGGPFMRQIRVHSPAEPLQHTALASLWARAKVKERLLQDYADRQQGSFPEAVQREVTALGVEFQLVTQFTSFVAVEELTVTVAGEPITIAVPVDIPAGVSYEGVFGQATAFASTRSQPFMAASPVSRAMKSLAHLGGSAPAEPLIRQRQEEMRDAAERDPSMVMQAKLAEPLRGLEEQVAKAGVDGNLTLGKLRVIGHRVDVMVYLRDTSPQTIDALKQLDFVQTGESKAARLLIGSIDVRQLAELAQLDAVIRIAPVVV
jgi:Ca-activated chloride channel family protein